MTSFFCTKKCVFEHLLCVYACRVVVVHLVLKVQQGLRETPGLMEILGHQDLVDILAIQDDKDLLERLVKTALLDHLESKGEKEDLDQMDIL